MVGDTELRPFNLGDILQQSQALRANQMKLDAYQQQQAQEQEQRSSLADLINTRKPDGSFDTTGAAWQRYVQSSPQDAYSLLGQMDAQKREAVKAGLADIAAAVKWADTPEKWAVVQRHYGQYDAQLAQVPFENREQALVEVGKLGDYLNGAGEQYTLSPGSIRFDAQGKKIAEAPFAPHYGTVGEGQSAYVYQPGQGGDAGSLFQTGILPIEGGTAPDGSFRTSPKGALGPAQLMAGTAPEAMQLAGFSPTDTRWKTDAHVNKAAGQAYYAKQLKDFGDPILAAAAYNAGPGRVQQALAKGGPQGWINYVPAETRAYVQNFAARTGGGAQIIAQGAPKKDKPPAGYRWKQDGTLEPIPGGPATRGGATGATRQQIGVAKQKVGFLNAVERQLNEVERLNGELDSKGFAGPVWGNIPGAGKFDGESAAYDKAIATLTALIRNVTRTPGEGAMSDYESRLAAAIPPNRSDNAEARSQSISDLRALIEGTRSGYQDMLGTDTQQSAPSTGGWGKAKVVQ